MRLREILNEQDEDYFTTLFQWLSQLNKTDKKKGDEEPRLIPVPREVPNEIKRLMGLVNFTIYGKEHDIISNKMRVSKVPATMTNIKRYLIGLMLLPIDEIPEPERTIILRSGKKERFGL
ncbi:MAG: hypothetical protein MN733_07100 [Nitrososphaera sp.]|nr:hypothetical protein [Nitrososphaera sp.]